MHKAATSTLDRPVKGADGKHKHMQSWADVVRKGAPKHQTDASGTMLAALQKQVEALTKQIAKSGNAADDSRPGVVAEAPAVDAAAPAEPPTSKQLGRKLETSRSKLAKMEAKLVSHEEELEQMVAARDQLKLDISKKQAEVDNLVMQQSSTLASEAKSPVASLLATSLQVKPEVLQGLPTAFQQQMCEMAAQCQAKMQELLQEAQKQVAMATAAATAEAAMAVASASNVAVVAGIAAAPTVDTAAGAAGMAAPTQTDVAMDEDDANELADLMVQQLEEQLENAGDAPKAKEAFASIKREKKEAFAKSIKQKKLKPKSP